MLGIYWHSSSAQIDTEASQQYPRTDRPYRCAELAPQDMTLNLVAPGLIDTKRKDADPAHRKSCTVLAGRLGKPKDIAVIVRLLAGPRGRDLTGQTIHINGGVYLP